MSRILRVLVSNPAKQHTPHLIIGLKKAGFDVIFATSFWTKRKYFKYFIEQFNSNFSNQFKKKYHNAISDSDVILNPLGVFFFFISRGIKNEELRSFLNDLIHDFWVKKWILKNKPDIVIGSEKSSLNSFIAAKKIGSIVILDLASIHVSYLEDLRSKIYELKSTTGSKYLFNLIKMRKISEYELSNRIFILSNYVKQNMLKYGIPETKLDIINLGVDLSNFKQKSNFIENDSLRLLYVGNISVRKGLSILSDVMSNLENISNITLTIIGPHGDASSLFKKRKNIKVIEYLDQNELSIVMSDFDVFVFPSYNDSWGMAVIEAMAVGLPVIASTNTGASELINENCGFIIEIGDRNSLEAIILNYYKNKYLIKAMGSEASKIATEYTWERYYSSLALTFKSILNNSN